VPSIRLISRPPAAAPAAGGRGIGGSWRVYRVGLGWLSAGGAEEVEASPEWLLRSSFPFSAGGAPVVCCGGSGDLFVLAALRSGGARESLAGDRETAALGVVDLKGDGVREQDDSDDAPGRRLVRAEFRRLPARRGAPPIPRRQGRSCSGAPAVRAGCLRQGRDPGGLVVYFNFVLGLSVRILFL
jgi:hypothetical protein